MAGLYFLLLNFLEIEILCFNSEQWGVIFSIYTVQLEGCFPYLFFHLKKIKDFFFLYFFHQENEINVIQYTADISMEVN